MKTVVIFCRYIDQAKPPFNTAYYTAAYIDLLLALKKQGVQAYFATNPTTYKGDGVFTTAYTTDKICPVADFAVVHNIKADVVYDKGDFTATDVTLLNPEYVSTISASKAETYKLFSKYQPLTFICKSRAELEDALQKLAGDLVVVKDPHGNGGHLVFIGSREKVLSLVPDTFPLLAQEFVDTSGGMDGLADGMHDLRIMMGGSNIWGSRVRMPAPGDFRANIAQGGSEYYISVDQIPTEPSRMAHEISQTFKDYPHYIALDFALTNKGWRLIELNSKPGLTAADSGPEAAHILNQLAAYLKQLTESTA
ncbi:MAG TPA: hypothetical protein VM581_03160 [Magnetospirillaceae bacterium]|nr:hypothetical protein [Magnetospirillaceae bacterium]